MEAGRLNVECGEVDLGAVLNEVAASMAVQARAKYLDLFCPRIPGGLRVHADESRLRQVFVNVIGNAIKFTQKGSVTISVDAPADAPSVEIRVRDTGIGVSEEKLGRLFKKFSQGDTSTTRKYGGTGLGLVIAKELVEMMGGSVRLESEGDGRGSTVTMRLARAPSATSARATAAGR